MSIRGVLIADVVDSSKLSDADRRQLDQILSRGFKLMNTRCKADLAAPFATTVGDEFEAVFKVPGRAVRPLMLLRAWLASQAGELSVAIRASVGIGPLSVESRPVARLQDGPAFHLAREQIANLKAEDRSLGIQLVGASSVDLAINQGLAIGCKLLEPILAGWSRPQWAVAYWRWMGLKPIEVAEKLAITKQSVSRHQKAGHFRLVDETINGFTALVALGDDLTSSKND